MKRIAFFQVAEIDLVLEDFQGNEKFRGKVRILDVSYSKRTEYHHVSVESKEKMAGRWGNTVYLLSKAHLTLDA